jgi:hypothetical protein
MYHRGITIADSENLSSGLAFARPWSSALCFLFAVLIMPLSLSIYHYYNLNFNMKEQIDSSTKAVPTAVVVYKEARIAKRHKDKQARRDERR